MAVLIIGNFVIRGFSSPKFATVVSGDYPAFQDINKMIEYADVIATIKVSKVNPSFIRTEKEVKGLNFVGTDSEATPTKVFKGNIEVGKKIILK